LVLPAGNEKNLP